MHMPVDMPTVLLAIVVVALSMGAAVLVSGWRLPRPDGLAFWGTGLLLLALGFGLFGLYTWLHLPWLLWLGNVLLSTAYALILLALAHFHQRRCSIWWLVGPIWLVALLSWVFWGRPIVQIMAVDVVQLAQWGIVGVSVWQCKIRPLERGRWLLLLGVGLMGLVYLGQIGFLLAHQMDQLPSAPLTQVMTLLVGLSGLVFLTLGYMLTVKECADAEFRRNAQLDVLTGVSNRSAFLDAFQHTLAQGARGNWPVALLMADIDKFKTVNDTYGHLAGDAVLRAVAQCMQGGLRAQDTLGRYGGEEFLVLLPDTPIAGAKTLAEHLRRSVQQMVVPWEGKNIAVTISIGVHGQIPTGVGDGQGLIDRADQAMYAAKRAGRNRVEVASPAEPPSPALS